MSDGINHGQTISYCDACGYPVAVCRCKSEPRYSVGTWDSEASGFTPQVGVPSINLTRKELVAAMRLLRDCGYSCHRYRGRDSAGNLNAWAADSDPSVMIERTDGMSEEEILKQWLR